LYVSDESIAALARSNTIATLLPLTAFSLKERYAPARKLIDAGCAVALATDFNPGSCYSNSIPMLVALSTLYMKMSAEEILAALTLNAAAALNRAETHGSIEVGKYADLAVCDVKSIDEMVYYFGHNCVKELYCKGRKAI
jgi:imidazolonepropionase